MKKEKFNYVIPNKPLSEELLGLYVSDKLFMLKSKPDSWITVAYEPIRQDEVSCVQVARMYDDDGFWVEWVTDTGKEKGVTIYSKAHMTEEETMSVFRQVLVDYEKPDKKEWYNYTDYQMYSSQAIRIIEEFPFIENPTEEDEFAYVEALDFMIGEIQENKVENIKKLAWFYGERRLFELERKYLEMAFDEGDTDAACELGYMWYYGQHGEVDYEKAYHYFKEGLKGEGANVFYCRYKLADMHRFGKHVNQDMQQYRDTIKEALEDMGEEPPDLSYPYPELAYRMAGIRIDDGNTSEATRLLKKARRFLAERLVRDNYWGSISIMQRIIRKMHEIVPDNEDFSDIYDIFRLEGVPCHLTFSYDGMDHEIEIADDGGVALDGRWYCSMGAFFEKCTLGGSKVTSIYDEFYGLAYA